MTDFQTVHVLEVKGSVNFSNEGLVVVKFMEAMSRFGRPRAGAMQGYRLLLIQHCHISKKSSMWVNTYWHSLVCVQWTHKTYRKTDGSCFEKHFYKPTVSTSFIFFGGFLAINLPNLSLVTFLKILKIKLNLATLASFWSLVQWGHFSAWIALCLFLSGEAQSYWTFSFSESSLTSELKHPITDKTTWSEEGSWIKNRVCLVI